MDRTWNRCLAAGTMALALGVGGSFVTGGSPAGCRSEAAAPAPVFSYFSTAPLPPAAVASRLTRALLCAFFC